MYTNLDTIHTLLVISAWLDSLELPYGFPLEVVKEVMALMIQDACLSEETCISYSSLKLQQEPHVPDCGQYLLYGPQDMNPDPRLW